MGGEPSWEQMVNDVCVHGRPERLKAASEVWGVVFTNGDSVAKALRDDSKQLESSWKGPAGDAYRAHLESLAKMVESVREKNKAVQPLLAEARDWLVKAQEKMPVPDYMLDEVVGKKAELDAANSSYGTFAAVVGTVVAAPIAIPAWASIGGASALSGGEFWNGLMSKAGNVTREALGPVHGVFRRQHRRCSEGLQRRQRRLRSGLSQSRRPERGQRSWCQ